MDETTKQCPQCLQIGIGPKPISEFYKNSARGDGLSPWCRLHHVANTTQRVQDLRFQAIEVLGGRCGNPGCHVPGGMADIRALQIDHVNSDGYLKRRFPKSQGSALYRRIIAGDCSDVQVLCANCNIMKKIDLQEHVGDRVYQRQVPTERIKGPGKGRSPGQQDGARDWWLNAPEEEVAAAIEKRASKLRGRKYPTVSEARRGTKLVDGHWVKLSASPTDINNMTH